MIKISARQINRVRSMTHGNNKHMNEESRTKRKELVVFLFLTVVVAPVLAVMTVGGYGLMVWIYQMFAGPPGPPA